MTRSTFFPLHHSRFLLFFKTFAPFLQNSAHFLLVFDRDGRFCKFSSNFRRFFSEFRRISVVLTGVMPILLDFRELANFLGGNLPKFPENVKMCETSTYWDPKNFAIVALDLCVPRRFRALRLVGGGSLRQRSVFSVSFSQRLAV